MSEQRYAPTVDVAELEQYHKSKQTLKISIKDNQIIRFEVIG